MMILYRCSRYYVTGLTNWRQMAQTHCKMLLFQCSQGLLSGLL